MLLFPAVQAANQADKPRNDGDGSGPGDSGDGRPRLVLRVVGKGVVRHPCRFFDNLLCLCPGLACYAVVIF